METINGYKVETTRRTKRGKTLLSIYNEEREQWEVYTLTQNPKIVPLGSDDESENVAFALALDVINHKH